MRGVRSYLKILLALTCIACCAVAGSSLAKPDFPGNAEAPEIVVSPEVEAAAKALFSGFFAYHDERRGMAPMTYRDAAGAVRTLADDRGRFLVVNFWATWCAPCARELPSLNALRAARGGDRLDVLAVSADFGMDPVQILDFMKRHKADGLRLAMPDETGPIWEIVSAGLPVTFILGPDGRVVYKMIGDADWTSPEILALIDDLLANDASAGKN